MDAAKDPVLVATKSYHAWWLDAGLDVLCADEPAGWLNAAQGDATDFDTYVKSLEASDKTKASPRPEPAHRADDMATSTDWPALPTALADLPEYYRNLCAITNRSCLAPMGNGSELLCIVTDMPTQGDGKSGQLFSGEDGILLSNMLKAIGLSRADVFIIAAVPYFTASPDYQAQADYWASLLRRQLSILTARHVLVLGDAGSRFLIGDNSAKMRGRLHDVNHDSGHISLSTSFHPMGLLKRPDFKRMAWQDLQLVTKALGTI